MDVQASLSGWPLEIRVGTGALEVRLAAGSFHSWHLRPWAWVWSWEGGLQPLRPADLVAKREPSQEGGKPGLGEGRAGEPDRTGGAGWSAWEKLRVGLEDGGRRDCERSRLNGEEQPRPPDQRGLVTGVRKGDTRDGSPAPGQPAVIGSREMEGLLVWSFQKAVVVGSSLVV